MKLAHLILAHSEPRQLERLINRLAHPDADIYIHLDKKTPAEPFAYLAGHSRVFFVNDRVAVYWGSYSIVAATINGFMAIAGSGKHYDYLNVLSGQDYPLKPPGVIHQYLADKAGTAFMKYERVDPDWLEALPRIQEYHLNDLRMPGRYTLQKLVNAVLPRRSIPGGLVPVGRSQWFTIPADCVSYLLDYWKSHARLRRFIKLTWAPDEFVFQTILYNSVYRSNMVNNDLRYIDWSGGGVSPKTLTVTDAAGLLASDALYARKFDVKKDAALLDLIDAHHADS